VNNPILLATPGMEVGNPEPFRFYVVFDHPIDHPNHFVVRIFLDDKPTTSFELATTLNEARAKMPKGLYCLPRDPQDDPKIVESWF
jgi:hypothetical protein